MLLLLIVSLWNIGPRHPTNKKSDATVGDAEFFGNVIAKMKNGESYYPVMGEELRASGYPTASVFNWRTPAWYYAMTWTFTPQMAILLTLGAAGVSFVQLRPVVARAGLSIALLGTLAAAHPIGVRMTEAMCGVLIAYSLFSYHKRAWNTGALIGLLALFVRELAAPYVLTCALIALWHRRWRESSVWAAGAVLYSAYFAWHVHMVTIHQLPGAVSQHQSWIQVGGLQFLLAIVSSNVVLFPLPTWAPAVMFVCIVGGLASPHLSSHVRMSTGVYLAAFAVIGQPFNWYWGWVTSFAFALAAAAGIEVIREQTILAVRDAAAGVATPPLASQGVAP